MSMSPGPFCIFGACNRKIKLVIKTQEELKTKVKSILTKGAAALMEEVAALIEVLTSIAG